MTTTTMTTKRLALALAAALFATGGLAACSKTASPPTTFGVNITLDGHAVGASVWSSASLVLDVSGAETKSVPLGADYTSALKSSGVVRFRYIPAVTTGTLNFVVTGTSGGNVVAQGQDLAVALQPTAVNITIVLAGSSGDGGTDAAGGADGSTGDAVMNPDGHINGTTCGAGTECESGICADGVCCDKACDGVCESCKLTLTKGTCTAIPEGTDPDNDCAEKTAVAPADTGDAGSEAGSTSSEAGAADSGGADSGNQSDAEVINLPDGGFMTTVGACAGTCNGARACKYPGAEKSCGKSFCNTRKDVGSFVCDGNGVCDTTLTACDMYACDDTKGSCRTTCQGNVDCQLDSWCNANANCVPKKFNGTQCATNDECVHGHCIIPSGATTGVCCNSQCDAPATCGGGSCMCPGVTCAAGVACQLFYKDADNDGYGDSTGTVANGRAVAGCTGATPPTGFVNDNTDCDDGNANAHPNQTTFFGVPRTNGSYDYDCDGKTTVGTPVYIGGSCRFCGTPGSCGSTTTTCANANTSSSFQCPQEGSVIVRQLDEPMSTPSEMSASSGVTVTRSGLTAVPGATATATPNVVVPCLACIPLSCCGCQAQDKTGFTSNVACGAIGTVVTCGTCAAAGGGPSVSTAARQQTCR